MRRENSEHTEQNASALPRVRCEDLAEPFERNGLDSMTIPSNDRRGHGQCVQDRFFCRFDGCRDDRIEMGIREMGQGIGRLFRIVGNDVRCGEGKDEVAAAMASG